jgi:ABC-type sugar transport system ATPase subunit
MAGEPYIRLRGVGKRYETKDGPVDACGDIDLDVRQSEFVAIVGPSGCGKTTILKMVAGLVPHSAGEITVGGKRVDRPLTEVGIVFQESILLDWRDVLSNVMLQIDIRDMERAAHEAVARPSAENHRPRRIRAQEALRALRRHAPARVDLPRAGARSAAAADGRARSARSTRSRASRSRWTSSACGWRSARPRSTSRTASRRRCCSPTAWW